ncbi:MAG: squalene synthase HpnC [Caulobacteraceae bacterium]
MIDGDVFDSGKGAGDENFPVGSFLIAPRHRPVVMAFYRVARMADDVADHPTASRMAKLARLGAIEAGLTGMDDAVSQAAHLRRLLSERGITDAHGRDLIAAFRLDVTKSRYVDWAELMDYCRLSAAPVGRFMLDVHGEDHAVWPMSDALCAALQVINHLQDCGEDYRALDRVYLPRDAMTAAGARIAALGAARATPALRRVIEGLARRAQELLTDAAPLAAAVGDRRLALEIGVIHRLAAGLAHRLTRRDPLFERVHHRPVEALGGALLGAAGVLMGSAGSRQRRQAAP